MNSSQLGNQLFEAAGKADDAEVQSLVRRGANVNWANPREVRVPRAGRGGTGRQASTRRRRLFCGRGPAEGLAARLSLPRL